MVKLECANTFSLAASGKILVIKRVFSDVSELPEIHIKQNNILKQVSIYLSCSGKCYNTIFPVKPQQGFVDYKTSPDFPSALGWADNDGELIL